MASSSRALQRSGMPAHNIWRRKPTLSTGTQPLSSLIKAGRTIGYLSGTNQTVIDPLSGDPNWSLSIPGFSVLIIPLLLKSLFKQVSVWLSGFASQFPLEGVLVLNSLIWCSDTLPTLSSPLCLHHSVTGWCFKAMDAQDTARFPGPESIPWLAHPQGSSSYLYPPPKSSPALFFPTGELLKNTPSSNPLSPQFFDNCISFCHQKNETMPFAATWMDLEIFIPREGSQTEKDNYHMISLTCGI